MYDLHVDKSFYILGLHIYDKVSTFDIHVGDQLDLVMKLEIGLIGLVVV